VDVNGNNINVSTGNHTISAPLVIAASTGMFVKPGATLTISGPFSINANTSLNSSGIITISGPQNHGVNSIYNTEGPGLTTFASNSGTPATATSPAIANLFISAGANASITFTADQDLRALGLATGDGPEHIDLASPVGPGAFRAIRIYSDDPAATKTALFASISNANAPGALDPTIGIFDSGRASHPGSNIGLAIVNDAHLDPMILIRLTRIGDLNLDGQVTISDFIDLASHFNGPGTWQEGDLNYDGQITISDFIDLASNFGSTYSGQTIPISDSDFALLTNFAAAHGVTLVPEPSVFILLLPLIVLMRRHIQRAASTTPTFFPTARS